MTNAKEELKELLAQTGKKIKCADISYSIDWHNDKGTMHKLAVEHTDATYLEFLDGLGAERVECNYYAQWVVRSAPIIPLNLI